MATSMAFLCVVLFLLVANMGVTSPVNDVAQHIKKVNMVEKVRGLPLTNRMDDGTDDNGTDDTDTDDTDTDDTDDKDDWRTSGTGSNSVSSTAGAGKSGCFPAMSEVTLENGMRKRMCDVEIGDSVAVGRGLYSKVFMFTHRLSDVRVEFVQLTTVNGDVVRATDGHYLLVNSNYVPAGMVQVGDVLENQAGKRVKVDKIQRVLDVGLFNPQTMHGDIVVDGLRASTYTTAVRRGLAHAALAPIRAIFLRLGLVCDAFESGVDKFAASA